MNPTAEVSTSWAYAVLSFKVFNHLRIHGNTKKVRSKFLAGSDPVLKPSVEKLFQLYDLKERLKAAQLNLSDQTSLDSLGSFLDGAQECIDAFNRQNLKSLPPRVRASVTKLFDAWSKAKRGTDRTLIAHLRGRDFVAVQVAADACVQVEYAVRKLLTRALAKARKAQKARDDV